MKFPAKLYPIALGAGIAVGPLTAAMAQVETETQVAVGGSYQMPAGNHSARGGAPIREARLHRPDEAGRLMELKGVAGGTAEPGAGLPGTAATQRASAQSIVTGASGGCQTNNATEYTPSDIHGAVGQTPWNNSGTTVTSFVVVTNVDVGVYSKTDCSLVSRAGLVDLFGATFTIPSSTALYDARVLYDPSVDRFLITADSSDDFTNDQYQYFAVSKDGSGTSWWTYAFILSQGSTVRWCKNRISDFWDYPSAGSSSTRWYVTANDFGTRNVTGAIISFDKKASLSGNPVNSICFNGLQTNIAPPIVTDTGTTAYFLSPGGRGFGSSIVKYALKTSSLGPTSDSLSSTPISIPSWKAAPQAPQPNGQDLDTLDGRFQSASIQTGTPSGTLLWNVHTINVGNYARWRLYQFSATANTATVLATPTTSDCNNCDHLFNPSVAVNASSGKAYVTASRTIPSNTSVAGNAAMLIFSGPSTSAWTGGTTANSAFNVIAYSASQYVYGIDNSGNYVPCNNTSIRACRWGDYSATQIDPSNTSTAWGFNQLITNISPGEPAVTEFDWTTNAGQVQ
jgi:hypothetical protein